MPIRIPRYSILAKQEGTYGSDATPDGTYGVRVVGIPKISTEVSPQIYSPSPFFLKSLTGVQYRTITFDCPLVGANVDTQNGRLVSLLECAGYKVDSTNYNLINDLGENTKSLTIYFYIDNVLHKLKGARGTAKFSFKTGELPIITFEFTGIYSAVSSGFVAPTAFGDNGTLWTATGMVATVNNTDYYPETCEFSENAQLSILKSFASADGIYRIELANFKPSGKIDFIVESSNYNSLESLVTNETSLTIRISKAEQIDFNLNAYGSGIETVDADGILRLSIPFQIYSLSLNFYIV